MGIIRSFATPAATQARSCANRRRFVWPKRAALPAALALLGGCAAYDPYVTQPKSTGTYTSTNAALDNVQDQLNVLIKSETLTNSATSAVTFAGTAGAAVSAAFSAATSQILGFTTAGATGFAVNGLYFSRTRLTIYNAGLDAVACMRDSIAPLPPKEREIEKQRVAVDGAVAGLQTSYETASKCGALSDDKLQTSARTDISDAQAAEASAEGLKLPLVGAVRAIVAAINSQVAKMVPDAAAMARAGTALSSQLVIPSSAPTQSQSAPAKQQPPAPVAPQAADLCKAPASDLQNDLRQKMAAVEVETTRLNALVSAWTRLTQISCKVADAPVLSPLTVVLPTGTDHIVFSGATATYRVAGGSGSYQGLTWTGTPPDFLHVYIQVPDTLVIEQVKGSTLKSGKYTFDIVDSLNDHLATQGQIEIADATTDNALTSSEKSDVTIAANGQHDITMSGGTPKYTATIAPPSAGLDSTWKDDHTLTLKAGPKAGSYSLQVTDSKATKLAPIKVTVTALEAPPGPEAPAAAAAISIGLLTGTTAMVQKDHIARFLIRGGSGKYTWEIQEKDRGTITPEIRSNELLIKGEKVGAVTLTIKDQEDENLTKGLPVSVGP